MTTAVLVIDVQNALCHGEWAAWEAEPLIERINTVTARARAAGVPVVFIQHEDDHPLLRTGSHGWQLAEGLVADAADPRIRKTTPDSFHRTELKALLDRLGVERLVVCGLQTEYCVDTTTRRALALGYPVTLVSDGHSTLPNGVLSAEQIRAHHNQTLGAMESFGVRATLVPAGEVGFDAAAPAPA